MTRQAALLIADAHALDLLTLLAVLPFASMSGEYGIGASLVYPVAGLAGVLAMKAAGVAALILVVGRSRLRLSLAVLAGLVGAAVNVAAFVILGGER